MGRAISLSFLGLLACGVVAAAQGQSRTVSTANMPKPGVSYIQGPSAPVRRETVSTATLPQVPRLYPGGGDGRDDGYRDDYPSNAADPTYVGGYVGGYYGSYPPGYGWNDRDRGHGRPGHGHDGHDGPGHDHDGHRSDNSMSVGVKPRPPTGAPRVEISPPRPPDRGHGGRSGWGGSNAPPIQPGTGAGHGPLPGTGVPMQGGGRDGR